MSDVGTEAVAAIATGMQDIRERVDGIAREILTPSDRTQRAAESLNQLSASLAGLTERDRV